QDLVASDDAAAVSRPALAAEDVEAGGIVGKGRQNDSPLADQEAGHRHGFSPTKYRMQMALYAGLARGFAVAVDDAPAAERHAVVMDGHSLFARKTAIVIARHDAGQLQTYVTQPGEQLWRKQIAPAVFMQIAGDDQ